jgi:hypothetical protein
MKNRIVVLKKGVEKKQVVVEGLCCMGGYVPYLWM